MLAGVLLHVVETALPMDAAVDPSGRYGPVHNVNDFFVRISNVQDVGVAELADIVRLAAGSGIQQSLIENHSPARPELGVFGFDQRFATENLRLKIVLER